MRALKSAGDEGREEGLNFAVDSYLNGVSSFSFSNVGVSWGHFGSRGKCESGEANANKVSKHFIIIFITEPVVHL